MKPDCLRAAGFALLAIAVMSCDGGKAELSGKVTYKGTPLTMGQVFVKASSGAEFSNAINSDGTYSIAGIPRGSFQVKITSIDDEGFVEYNKALAGRGKTGDPIGPDGKVRPKGSPILEASAWAKIPAKYGEYDKSGLTVEVKDAKATKDFNLD